MLAIDAGNGTFSSISRPEDFWRFRARVSFFAPFLSPPLLMLKVAVGSPDRILARNSTASVTLALVAGVANGPPLEARGCEGKRCYRPVSPVACTPRISLNRKPRPRFHPKNLISLIEILNARNQQGRPKRVRCWRPSPAWYQRRLGAKQDVETLEALDARRQVPPQGCRL